MQSDAPYQCASWVTPKVVRQKHLQSLRAKQSQGLKLSHFASFDMAKATPR
ncbi:MAG: hypothetical protein ACKO3K_16135 [Cuspidothrix sp.]